MKSSMKEIIMLGVVLGLVSMIAALGLSVTYSVTKERIQKQAELALDKARKEIFPEANEFVINEEMTGKTVGSTVVKEFYSVLGNNQEELGVLFTANTPGYGGNIVFILGLTNEGLVKSVRVTEHTETPGLGANIIKPSFLDQFHQKKISDDFIVKKDVKAITAATISSKALTNGIKSLIDLSKSLMAGDGNE